MQQQYLPDEIISFIGTFLSFEDKLACTAAHSMFRSVHHFTAVIEMSLTERRHFSAEYVRRALAARCALMPAANVIYARVRPPSSSICADVAGSARALTAPGRAVHLVIEPCDDLIDVLALVEPLAAAAVAPVDLQLCMDDVGRADHEARRRLSQCLVRSPTFEFLRIASNVSDPVITSAMLSKPGRYVLKLDDFKQSVDLSDCLLGNFVALCIEARVRSDSRLRLRGLSRVQHLFFCPRKDAAALRGFESSFVESVKALLAEPGSLSGLRALHLRIESPEFFAVYLDVLQAVGASCAELELELRHVGKCALHSLALLRLFQSLGGRRALVCVENLPQYLEYRVLRSAAASLHMEIAPLTSQGFQISPEWDRWTDYEFSRRIVTGCGA